MKTPSADHPISLSRAGNRIIVKVGDHIIADTRRAWSLQEANYPEVLYLPREDVDMSLVERSDHTTYCPYKGDCAYYSIPAGGTLSVNAIWSYEDPYPAVIDIKGHIAFYQNRVSSFKTVEVGINAAPGAR